jgi:hypothetical protein
MFDPLGEKMLTIIKFVSLWPWWSGSKRFRRPAHR